MCAVRYHARRVPTRHNQKNMRSADDEVPLHALIAVQTINGQSIHYTDQHSRTKFKLHFGHSSEESCLPHIKNFIVLNARPLRFHSQWPCGNASSGSVPPCGARRWRTCPSRRCSPPAKYRGSRCHRMSYMWEQRRKGMAAVSLRANTAAVLYPKVAAEIKHDCGLCFAANDAPCARHPHE